MAERTIGVALSGGGHRATLFGLGSLLALADAGLNERIVSVSSVSGGSIANGIVLSRLDLGTSTAEDL
jgi:predicted acylesterase/phospholipase RssA